MYRFSWLRPFTIFFLSHAAVSTATRSNVGTLAHVFQRSSVGDGHSLLARPPIVVSRRAVNGKRPAATPPTHSSTDFADGASAVDRLRSCGPPPHHVVPYHDSTGSQQNTSRATDRRQPTEHEDTTARAFGARSPSPGRRCCFAASVVHITSSRVERLSDVRPRVRRLSITIRIFRACENRSRFSVVVFL